MKRQYFTFFLLLCVLAGCERPDEEAAEVEEPPAQTASRRGVVQLDQQAQTAIGIKTAKVTRRPHQQTLKTTGWLVIPPGKQSVVKAAATGYYLPGAGKAEKNVGSRVSQGSPLGSLEVFLSPQESAQLVIAKEEADLVMNQALVSQRLAEEQLKKLEQGGGSAVVSGKQLLELKEIIQRNQVAYTEAREKLPFLPVEPYADQMKLKSISIESPLTGIITDMHVAPRQLVVQGDPLWTIGDWSTLWIRIPVFAGDYPRVQPVQPAQVSIPGTLSVEEASRVAHPQPSEPGRRTVDVYYRLSNPRGLLRPGQPLQAELPLGQKELQTSIPRSAVIWDGMGNAWVYLQVAPSQFRRQKVELASGAGQSVAVDRGLQEGEIIVTDGAQSLYGEEFKGELQAEDDD